jgi:hypothetical protein
MDDLTYTLRALRQRNRDGSHATQADRLRTLTLASRQLSEAGFRQMRTKGGRPRTVPISTAEQRTVLDQAHRLAGAGSLIPAHKTYIQQRHTYDGQCKAAGLSNMHGLRHHYAQARYEALTGWKAPAAGGPVARMLTSTQRAQDISARQTISRELGHERPQITAVYLGR